MHSGRRNQKLSFDRLLASLTALSMVSLASLFLFGRLIALGRLHDIEIRTLDLP
jgi:hypothetical protein